MSLPFSEANPLSKLLSVRGDSGQVLQTRRPLFKNPFELQWGTTTVRFLVVRMKMSTILIGNWSKKDQEDTMHPQKKPFVG